MTTKEYLVSISRLESQIVSKKQRAEAFRFMASSMGSNSESGMPKSPSKQLSPMAEAVCKAVDLEAEIKQDELLLQQKRVFLLELIGTLSDADVQSVIIKRHFEKKSWNKITSETFFSRSWASELHRVGIEELDKKIASSTYIP